MAQNVVIRDVVYQSVPSVEIPLSGSSGNAVFTDTSDATLANGSEMLSGVTAYGASGAKISGSIETKTGSDLTASGATVYYAPDELRLTNPTTCAIDPVIHDFGDLFYIEEFDRVYIAQDTGSAVKQKHLDLYLPDDMYNYALSITGYYTVYSVEYVDTTYRPADYDIREAVAATVLGSYFTTD